MRRITAKMAAGGADIAGPVGEPWPAQKAAAASRAQHGQSAHAYKPMYALPAAMSPEQRSESARRPDRRDGQRPKSRKIRFGGFFSRPLLRFLNLCNLLSAFASPFSYFIFEEIHEYGYVIVVSSSRLAHGIMIVFTISSNVESHFSVMVGVSRSTRPSLYNATNFVSPPQ